MCFFFCGCCLFFLSHLLWNIFYVIVSTAVPVVESFGENIQKKRKKGKKSFYNVISNKKKSLSQSRYIKKNLYCRTSANFQRQRGNKQRDDWYLKLRSIWAKPRTLQNKTESKQTLSLVNSIIVGKLTSCVPPPSTPHTQAHLPTPTPTPGPHPTPTLPPLPL